MIILRIVLLGHGTGGADTGEFSVRLIGALAGLAAALGIDPGESGWGRILDALLLIVAHPVPPPEG